MILTNLIMNIQSILNFNLTSVIIFTEVGSFDLILADLVKTIHLFCIFAGIGGAISQALILQKHRNADAREAEASEKMALVITKFAEFYGLVLAFVTGMILAVITNAFSHGGYLHAKTTLVIVLIGLSHVDLRNLKRMVALRGEGKTAEANQLKQTHLILSKFSLLIAIAIVILVVFKPF